MSDNILDLLNQNWNIIMMLGILGSILLMSQASAVCTSCISEFKRPVSMLRGLNVTGNFTILYNPPYTDIVGFSYNQDENSVQISTDNSDLILNPSGEVKIPYGKSLTIGDTAGSSRLALSTVGSHALMSTGSDLRITTYRNLEIKASNTIFPAVNAITYLLASNSARYNELRAVYGTGTGSTRYISVWHDGTNGNIRSNSGNLVLGSNNTMVVVNYNLTIGATGFPGCLQMRDSDDGGWTKCITQGGALNCSIGIC